MNIDDDGNEMNGTGRKRKQSKKSSKSSKKKERRGSFDAEDESNYADDESSIDLDSDLSQLGKAIQSATTPAMTTHLQLLKKTRITSRRAARARSPRGSTGTRSS